MASSRLSLRSRFALAAGRAIGALSRGLGRGSGVVLRGRLALMLDSQVISKLAANRRSVIVTGTNGKSTTTRLIVAALGGDVATNVTGANMAPGVVTALDESSSELAVLEVDELHVPSIMRQVLPQVLVLLNVTRDQLDRTLEVSKTAQLWGKTIDEQSGVKVVANVADPHVVAAAMHGDPVWVDPGGPRWTDDATVCPKCGALLHWDDAGRWSCDCGFTMPEPHFALTESAMVLPDGSEIEFTLKLPGDINRGNAVCAMAAAITMGVDPAQAAARIAHVEAVEGRYSIINVGGRRAPLLLAKNPAGWAAALTMVPDDAVVMVGINARIADGTDTSWLWDVPFEQLAGKTVGATGERRDDLAVRLHYAGAKPLVHEDSIKLATQLPEGDFVVIANYTVFRDLRRYVERGHHHHVSRQHDGGPVLHGAAADNTQSPDAPLLDAQARDSQVSGTQVSTGQTPGTQAQGIQSTTAQSPGTQSSDTPPTGGPSVAPSQGGTK